MTSKKKTEYLIVIEDCRADGLGFVKAGTEVKGKEIEKYKALLSAKHYRTVNK